MKTPFKSFLAASAFAVIFAGAPAFAADTLKLDARHTSVTFGYTHGGFSHMTGKFMNAAGSVTLDQAAPAKSSVEVSFDISGVNTGVPGLDDHLKTADFFDVAQFPTATFKSTKVDITGADTAKVTGDLTMHGVTKPVTLAVKLNKLSDDKKKAGFSATTTIKRSDFGISKLVPIVSDDIDITIDAEAAVPKP